VVRTLNEHIQVEDGNQSPQKVSTCFEYLNRNGFEKPIRN
jgi:hypothetical protein